MADQETGLPGDSAVSSVEIPDLKKKDKERKKSGIPLAGGSPAAGAFNGAMGAARAAASAAAGSAPSAVASVSLLARLTATLAGKLILTGAAAVVVGGGAIVGSSLLKGNPGPAKAGPDLGGIESMVKIDKPGEDSAALKFAGTASRGQLKFEQPTNAAPKAPEPQAEQKIEEAAAPAAVDQLEHTAIKPQDQLAHNLSGAKLTTSLGGGFGGKNIFAGNNAPKFGEKKFGAAPKLGKSGRGSIKAVAQASAASGKSATRKRGFSGRAFGQLKLARAMSRQGASRTGEGARSAAADAFDQGQTNGDDGKLGVASTGPADGTGTVNPGDFGAPDITAPADVTAGTDASPWKNELDQAFDMGKQAKQMKNMGIAMIAVGTILLAIGIYILTLSSVPWLSWMAALAYVLILAGGAMIGAGAQMVQKAGEMADQAKKMGDEIAKQKGQADQAKIIRECMDRAINDGTDPDDCKTQTAAEINEKLGKSKVKDAVEKEEKSDYNLQGEGPIGE